MTVIDITQAPYRVVAQYKNNQIAPFLLPNLLYAMATRYNKAYVLTEVNDIGQEIIIMHNEMEYENLMVPRCVGERSSYGWWLRQLSSPAGCSLSPRSSVSDALLKEMIEQDKLPIEDYDVINELSAFVEKVRMRQKPDTMMTWVQHLFSSWTSTQLYFKD